MNRIVADELQFDITGLNTASVTGIIKNVPEVVIPEKVSDESGNCYRVTSIGRKAFLGTKGIRSVTIPSETELVGDWALAKCIHLNEVNFERVVSFGRGVFEGCERLNRIAFKTLDEEALPYLLSAAVNKFEAGYLLRDSDLGSKEWFSRWDLALKSFIATDDIEGYDDRALCGEEDISFDGVGSVDGEMPGDAGAYLNEVGKNKCYLCLLRLRYNKFLDSQMRTVLEAYVKARAFGTSKPFAWKTLKEDVGEETEFLEIYINVVKPDKDILTEMIEDLGSNRTALRAYLIRKSNESKTAGFDDFFASMTIS